MTEDQVRQIIREEITAYHSIYVGGQLHTDWWDAEQIEVLEERRLARMHEQIAWRRSYLEDWETAVGAEPDDGPLVREMKDMLAASPELRAARLELEEEAPPRDAS